PSRDAPDALLAAVAKTAALAEDEGAAIAVLERALARIPPGAGRDRIADALAGAAQARGDTELLLRSLGRMTPEHAGRSGDRVLATELARRPADRELHAAFLTRVAEDLRGGHVDDGPPIGLVGAARDRLVALAEVHQLSPDDRLTLLL